MDNKKNNMEKPVEELVGQFYEQRWRQLEERLWKDLYRLLLEQTLYISKEED